MVECWDIGKCQYQLPKNRDIGENVKWTWKAQNLVNILFYFPLVSHHTTLVFIILAACPIDPITMQLSVQLS